MRRSAPLFALALFTFAGPAAADTTLTLDGTVTDDGVDHVRVPFEVPAGTAEIGIAHDDLSDADILDFGLDDPSGFRGWGGGNTEDIVVGELAASRSYLAGTIAAGTWNVVIGKAKLVEGSADYHLVITLRDAPTLPPQPERTPYVPVAPLAAESRWYAGDFHVHSIESGDARPPLDEIATFARSQGLDFVELSDHNTVSQLDFLNAAQAAHPDLLFLPGVEYTTYDGHANGVGATQWVDHKIGQPGVDIAGAAAAFRAQGALFAINHPTLDLGSQCIGCAWKHALSAEAIDAVEVATSGANVIFGDLTFDFWDDLCDTGRHVAAIGGSDDHGAGQDLGSFGTPIGTPTTYVFAEGLSAASIVEGVRAGRTVVKIGGPGDPMIEMVSVISPELDTVHAESTVLRATITGGAGLQMAWVKNGKRDGGAEINGDPAVFERRVTAPATGQDRYRVEVLRDGSVATVTSHLWFELRAGVGVPDATGAADESGCGCAVAGEPDPAGTWSLGAWLGLLGGFVLRGRRARGKLLGKPQKRRLISLLLATFACAACSSEGDASSAAASSTGLAATATTSSGAGGGGGAGAGGAGGAAGTGGSEVVPEKPAALVDYVTGNDADADVSPLGPGLLLMGGSTDVDAAFAWWKPLLAGGDVVVLRTSGADGYNDYLFNDIGGCDSVETMLVDTASLANDPYVAHRIAHAEGIFLAGGDQATYMSLWKDTPVEDALMAAWQRGAVLGGTSAGCAVLGAYVFAAYNDTVYSDEALGDPYNVFMTMERDFLSFPPLAKAITDTHFGARDRMGRLVGFLARIVQDGWAAEALGLGIDEETALVVDPAGVGTVVGIGSVYLVRTSGAPATCAPGTPLEYANLPYHELVAGDTVLFPEGTTTVPAATLSASGGTLSPVNPY